MVIKNIYIKKISVYFYIIQYYFYFNIIYMQYELWYRNGNYVMFINNCNKLFIFYRNVF